MPDFQIGDFVWAKMTGYPYWPGKIVKPDTHVKKPNRKREMFYVLFYGTRVLAWVRCDFIHKYDENKEKYAQGSDVPCFVDAVKDIEKAINGKSQGLSENDVESATESEDDDKPLATLVKSERTNAGSALTTPLNKKRNAVENSLPSREELTLKHQNMSHYLLTRSTLTSTTCNANFVPPTVISLPPQHCEKLPFDSTTIVNNATTIPKVIPLKKKVGFLGLSILGGPMAMNLLRTGHDVTVWGRKAKQCKPLLEAGAKPGLTPADVVRQCDLTFSCFSDFNAERDVLVGEGGVLKGISCGKGYIEMSTVDPDTIKELSDAIAVSGGRFLEAPILGNKKSAELGELVILAAGDHSLYTDTYSCFQALGKKTFYLGNLGCGGNAKVIANMMIGTLMTSLAEGLALAEKLGLNSQNLFDVLDSSEISCSLVKTRAMLEGHFPADYPLKHMQTDMELSMQMGESLEQPLHVACAANELYKRTKAMGFGDRDQSYVYKAINP